jgi:hypothetical protein
LYHREHGQESRIKSDFSEAPIAYTPGHVWPAI